MIGELKIVSKHKYVLYINIVVHTQYKYIYIQFKYVILLYDNLRYREAPEPERERSAVRPSSLKRWDRNLSEM